MSDPELGLKLFKRAEKLRAARSSVFDPAWQEISQYFLPDLSDINTEKTEGTTGWFDRIYESTPIRAASTCSVGVRNWVTPSTDPWLTLTPPPNLPGRKKQMNPRLARLGNPGANPEDDSVDEATRFLAEKSEEFTHALQSCNFYSVIQPFNRGACVFGTALLYMEEGKTELFRFEQFKVGTFCVAENDQKIVDTVFRWFKLTVRQACQKFGEEKMPKKIKEAYAKQRYDEMFEFIHCVYPNEDYKKGKLGAEGMAYASIYIAIQEKKVVSEGGYEEMPYFCLRWTRWGTDDQAWGCSPAFETLPEARQLNFVTQYQDALAELKAFPRLLYPDNLDGNIQLAAGSVTTYEADKPDAIPREWLSAGDYQNTKEMLDDKRAALNQAFFVDIFKMFDQLDPSKQHTAFEIAQRSGEKLDKFTGTFDQYVTELINPLVRRGLGIMARQGLLEGAPESLMVRPNNDPKAEPELAVPRIEINSRVTLAIKALRNTGVQNTLSTLQPLAEARPEILDNFDLDKVARDTGRNFGMPEKDFRQMKYVIELRNARAKQQQEERAMALAEQAATAGGKLGKAPQQMQDAAMNQLAKAS